MDFSGAQSFYLEHTDDIICLAVNQHPKFKTIVATGQIGNPPSVHIWNAITKDTVSILKGEHSKGICSVDFSCTGKYVVSVGLEHNVTVWRWQEGNTLTLCMLGNFACVFFLSSTDFFSKKLSKEYL